MCSFTETASEIVINDNNFNCVQDLCFFALQNSLNLLTLHRKTSTNIAHSKRVFKCILTPILASEGTNFSTRRRTKKHTNEMIITRLFLVLLTAIWMKIG